MTDFFDKLKDLSARPAPMGPNHTGRIGHGNLDDARGSQGGNLPPDPGSQPSLPDDFGVMPVSTEPDQERPVRSPSVRSRRYRRRLSLRDRFKQWFNFRKPLYQQWWLWTILGLGAAAGGTYVTIDQSLRYIQSGLPDPEAIFSFARTGTLTIKASDGTVLQQQGPATREQLSYDEIPDRLIEAFISAEDKNFYDHTGVDYGAIARAVRANLLAGEVVEGGSTITQQLARMVFLDQAPTLDRKLREALLAQKIELELSKEQILERYLNLVYLGSGAYGVADAAWIYFSKPVDELTLSEMAMIAGLAPAPSAFSPLVNLDAAMRRRDSTLERMVEAEFITAEEMERVQAQQLTLNPSLPRNLYSATPYFTSYIEEQLPNYVSQEQIEQGGLIVETTLNLEWQRIAETTIQEALTNYGQGQRFAQAAMVTIDPRTGEIKTMVGGTDFGESQFNRVTQAQRQPGSTFKTFVYAAAIGAGFSPYKPYVDAKFVVDGYEPENYSRQFRGTISIRDALVSSINVVAVKTLIDVGFDPVINLAQAMGIKSELMPTYSLALGASEVNLLELTSAYGTLAAQGNYIEPHGIVRIRDRFNEVIYESDFTPQRALDENSTAIVTWMLEGVVQNGTGRRARLDDRPVAGKTGTSEELRDLWFVGFIPQLVTGVWLGNDDNKPTYGASSTAAQTWRNFMANIVGELPVEEFPELPDLNNRDGTIEAQPVEPRQMRTASGGGQSEAPQQSQSPAAQPAANNSSNEGDRPSNGASGSDGGAEQGEGSGREGGSEEGGSEEAPAPARDTAPQPAPQPAPAPAPPPPPLPSIQPVAPSAPPAPVPAGSGGGPAPEG